MDQKPRKLDRKRKSTIRRLGRAVLLIILAVGVLAVAAFVYLYSTSRTVRDIANVIATRSLSPHKAFPNRDRAIILLLGKDQDRDEHGQIVHTRGRTDAIMVVSADFKQHTMSILSIPRDTLVRIPGYRGKRRINSAHALGGPKLAEKTVRALVGVQPDYYMLVNFQGFEKAIDGIGGLNVNVDKQLDYDDNWGNLHVHLKPGEQLLNGNQAVGFARFRHSNDGHADSDFTRIGRQQALLSAAREKLKNPWMLARVPHALDAMRGDMHGNLTPAQMVCLAAFARSLPPENPVTMEVLPALEGESNYVRPDQHALRELASRMFRSSRQPKSTE